MNIRDEIKQLKTGARELRKFGFLVGGVFAALGVVLLLRHRPAAPYLLGIGGFLILFGLIAPRALKHIYLVWMSLAVVLGFIVSSVLLTLFFFLVITPIGWVARCFGNDFLSLKLNRAAASYWIPRERKPKAPAEYERQF
ncbi:MAG TPA: SxtJ family membrane protein [Methylomirabilota bacterium]|nr:SxtJ family membrane protein [Methylomirabilota bacterium]